jgi:MFS family permease
MVLTIMDGNGRVCLRSRWRSAQNRGVRLSGGPFSFGEFRALWLARGLSLLGDQLARVAIAVLVYDRTNSPALTGVTYALTFLPYLAGPLAAGIGDRRSRRGVIIALDFARALVVAVMALPGMPLPVVVGLLVLVTAASPVYDASRSAMLSELLPAEIYPTGLGIFTITTEAAQVVGFALGGILVAAVGATPALFLDAFTFLAAGIAVSVGIRPRPAAVSQPQRPAGELRNTLRLIGTSPELRRLLALAGLNSFWVVPEGLAAPYARTLHGGPVAVGLLLAAIPFGCVLGATLLMRCTSHEQRLQSMLPLAAATGLPLLACAAHPGLSVTLVLWGLCGVGTAYNCAANAAYVAALPNSRRSQGIAVAAAGMVTGQGVAILLAGVISSAVAPWRVVGVCGLIATTITFALAAKRPVRVAAGYAVAKNQGLA